LGTPVLESGGGIGKLKCDEQPLFRSQSPGFVNLLLRKLLSKLVLTPGMFETRGRSFK